MKWRRPKWKAKKMRKETQAAETLSGLASNVSEFQILFWAQNLIECVCLCVSRSDSSNHTSSVRTRFYYFAIGTKLFPHTFRFVTPQTFFHIKFLSLTRTAQNIVLRVEAVGLGMVMSFAKTMHCEWYRPMITTRYTHTTCERHAKSEWNEPNKIWKLICWRILSACLCTSWDNWSAKESSSVFLQKISSSTHVYVIFQASIRELRKSIRLTLFALPASCVNCLRMDSGQGARIIQISRPNANQMRNKF